MFCSVTVIVHIGNPEGVGFKFVASMNQETDLVIRFCKDVESRSQTVVHISTIFSSTLPLPFYSYFY